MHKVIYLLIAICISNISFSQDSDRVIIKITDDQQNPLPNATVELLKQDSSLVKISMSDSSGNVSFDNVALVKYIIRVSRVGFAGRSTAINLTESKNVPPIELAPASGTLQNVTVSGTKKFIELMPDKTVVNLEASITSVGATAMEALEKMPGITVDRDGNISLKGKGGVLVLIDGKQTYLGGAELASMLNGMSASSISQVEIMDQPSARYDAAGNAGIINIKMKKTKIKGFNSSVNTTYIQGKYPKNNNSLQLNYRTGPVNLFLNYSFNMAEYFTRVYALRTYFEPGGKTIASLLEQPSFLSGKVLNHNLRTGIDYAISAKTTIGLVLNGLRSDRDGGGNNTALWMDANRMKDSLISTSSTNSSLFKNGGVNVNMRHQFNTKKELTADFDMLGYTITGDQFFENSLVYPTTYTEASRANIPSDIKIMSGKADYSQQFKKLKVEGGWKSSHITTDNLAEYEYKDGAVWKEDLGKSNHFIYEENIHALYTTAQASLKKWSAQGGLRYEMTSYDAEQLGNSARRDSSFSRSYNSLFPSLFLSFAADSNNTFTVNAGKRIDRPAFQKLNPFLFIINKYTYQQGNPFYRPQYTWNFQLNHSFKGILLTGISYSHTKDYFSQVFTADSNDVVIYTEGNLSSARNFGASASVQLSPKNWWSFSGQVNFNRKKIKGILWKDYTATISQMNFSINNQFRFNKGWSAELTGFYNTRSQADIQEVVDPAGQLSVGVSKNILKNKATIRLAFRDVFYTNAMAGMTYFEHAEEYFKLTRDTRVAALSFTYRFGKAFKTSRRSEGSAGDEIQRVGTGN